MTIPSTPATFRWEFDAHQAERNRLIASFDRLLDEARRKARACGGDEEYHAGFIADWWGRLGEDAARRVR